MVGDSGVMAILLGPESDDEPRQALNEKRTPDVKEIESSVGAPRGFLGKEFGDAGEAQDSCYPCHSDDDPRALGGHGHTQGDGALGEDGAACYAGEQGLG